MSPTNRDRRTEPKPMEERFGTKAKNKAYEKAPERLKHASSLQVRLRTGAIYISLTAACILINETVATAMLAVTAAICAGEFFWMERVDAKLPNEELGVIGAACYPFALLWFGMTGVMLVTIILLLALLVWYTYFMRSRIADVAISFFGAAYTGLMICGILVIRQSLPEPWGGVLCLLLFFSIWFNDGLAYLVGRKFGKHKLAPRTSPKKSWEGFFGGLFASAVLWVAMSFVPGVNMPIWEAILFGVFCGACGVLGDLVESRMKRNAGVKDSGTIMPGHGGLLDRCDSLFVCSVVACALLIMGGCIPNVYFL
ncbi:MAG: phosphatidate cytidylyltransferase [Eggerthellaceae bacterium]|jgi:phosphatidate cytidylyltransferase